MRSIKSRLATGSLWISGARGATTLLTLISTVMLARILVPSDFGLVALASTLLAVLTSVTNLSVASALVHHRNPTEQHYHTAWTLGVARGFVLAAGFCLLGWPLARLYGEPRLDEVMYALSLSVLLSGFTNPLLIMMKKQLVFWQLFVLQVANNLVMAVVAIVVALIYDSYWALVAGAVAGQLTHTLLSYVLLPFRPRVSWKHVRELLSFSVWLTLGQAVNTLNYRFDDLLLGGFLGRTALGYYSVGSNLAASVTREAILPLTQTLYPAFSLLSDNLDRLQRGYQRAQAVVTAIGMPAGIGFALVADPLVRLAMGAKWAPAVAVIQIIGSIYALGTLGRLVGPVAMAMGATKLLFSRSLQLFVMRLPFIVAGMYFWGLMGVLYARALVGVLGIVINMAMIRSLIGLTLRAQLRANLRCLAASAVMVAAVLALQQALPAPAGELELAIEVSLTMIVGAAAYFLSSWWLWVGEGRPLGPETEALALIAGLRGRLPFRPGAAPPDLG